MGAYALVICIELAGRKSEQELSARNALRSLRERESGARRSCCVCRAKPSGAGKRAVAKRAKHCVACASESLNQVNIKIIAKKNAPAYCRSSDKKKIIKKPSEELNSQCTLADERNAKCII